MSDKPSRKFSRRAARSPLPVAWPPLDRAGDGSPGVLLGLPDWFLFRPEWPIELFKPEAVTAPPRETRRTRRGGSTRRSS